MAKADHIYVHRRGYTHHGIDVGDGTVIHYTGEPGRKAAAAVRRTRMAAFSLGARVMVRQYARCAEWRVVLRRAFRRQGESRYHLVFNNCEHFAVWCKTGERDSEQVRDAVAAGTGSVGTGAAVVAGVSTVGATGAAAGLSGAGIMSGLATIGGTVGGGAVAGMGVIGAAPAGVAVLAMRRVLRDDATLPMGERQARCAGRVGTVVGGAAGTVAGVATVSAAGTVAGLSAAGITSGLAAVGAAAGGGMAAGVGIVAAAPAVAAVGIGYGIYRVWRWSAS